MNIVKLVNRTIAREHLASILGQIGTFVAVYDHEIKDFQGLSPVATIHSDGTQIATNFRRQIHAYRVSLWWARSDDDDTEDLMDGLTYDVLAKLSQHRRVPGKWQSLQMDTGFSEMAYPIVDGQQYRLEVMRVLVQPWQT
jgi:hypothetical protein